MEPYLGEIRCFAYGIVPQGWAQCNGQVIPVQQNAALFSLLGTQFGGDGKNNFQLPDLRGRAIMPAGGLVPQGVAHAGGTETVALTASQVPSHTHTINGQAVTGAFQLNTTGVAEILAQGAVATKTDKVNMYAGTPAANTLVNLTQQTIGSTGASVPHNNMQPFVTLNFCISLQGYYPPRN